MKSSFNGFEKIKRQQKQYGFIKPQRQQKSFTISDKTTGRWYLYKDGVVDTATANGFTIGDYTGNYTYECCSRTVGANYLQIWSQDYTYNRGSTFMANGNANIDFSKYTKLHILCDITLTGSTSQQSGLRVFYEKAYCAFSTSASTYPTQYDIGAYYTIGTKTNYDMVFDITSITDKGQLWFQPWAYNYSNNPKDQYVNVTVYQVWFE